MSLYFDWLAAKHTLDTAKKEELRLRKLICASQLEDKLEGSKTVTEDGFKVTATAKLTRSIDAAVLETVWDQMTAEEQACITYKPSLNLAAYRKVEDSATVLSEAITVKPATPTLKIVPAEEE